MFTGIIEEVGVVRRPGSRLVIECSAVLSDLTEGASVSVSGVCLTALAITPDSFSADLAPETLDRTNLGGLREGSLVNLERALLPTTRLSGHIVQGHVDGTGIFLSLDALRDGNWWMRIQLPPGLERYFVYKGSIALDGISLTIAEIEKEILTIAIIPHTYQHTALRSRRPGDRVNIECDVISKHIEKLLASTAR